MMTDHEQLQDFAKALGSRAVALRRDECGDWRINGQKGHIYVYDPTAFLLVIHAGTVRGWESAKRALPWCRVSQDGDTEGCIVVPRLPTEDEAGIIRHHLAISKKRVLSPEQLERLAKFGFKPHDSGEINGLPFDKTDEGDSDA
jgi:hypothetical protein